MINIEQITSAIDYAIAALGDGWDWAQDFTDSGGDRHVISGPSEIDDLPDEKSRTAAREYAEFVATAYTEAAEEARRARDAVETGDIETALEAIEAACRLERETGDAAATTPIRSMLESLDDSIGYAIDDLAAIESAWNRDSYAEVLTGQEIWGPGQPSAESSYTPGDALDCVLEGLPREFWGEAMRRAGVSAELQEHMDTEGAA